MGNIKGPGGPEGNIELSSLNVLETHPDPQVRNAAQTLTNMNMRQSTVLTMVKETLQQLRLDMTYLIFDLGCTRRERNDLQAKLAKLDK